ncbi:MAG TPA: hypothetical protein VE733_04600 [Streptosporangiaceae bacterium]|nr:hypothetical protein [Streptosporangiaceae bacterium]
MKWHTELEMYANSPVDDDRFDALADALADVEDTDPAVEDADLGGSLTAQRVTATMVVTADTPDEAVRKTVTVVRTAVQAIGDGTPRWETQAPIIRLAPAEESERLFTSA